MGGCIPPPCKKMAITPNNNDPKEPKLGDFSYISMTNLPYPFWHSKKQKKGFLKSFGYILSVFSKFGFKIASVTIQSKRMQKWYFWSQILFFKKFPMVFWSPTPSYAKNGSNWFLQGGVDNTPHTGSFLSQFKG